jgi:hypothetical protein
LDACSEGSHSFFSVVVVGCDHRPSTTPLLLSVVNGGVLSATYNKYFVYIFYESGTLPKEMYIITTTSDGTVYDIFERNIVGIGNVIEHQRYD